jgi:hypothetical protein
MAARTPNAQTTTEPERVQLTGREVQVLPREALVMRVLKGMVWVAADGVDYVAKSGEELRLPQTRDVAVATGLKRATAVYEVVLL